MSSKRANGKDHVKQSQIIPSSMGGLHALGSLARHLGQRNQMMVEATPWSVHAPHRKQIFPWRLECPEPDHQDPP